MELSGRVTSSRRALASALAIAAVCVVAVACGDGGSRRAPNDISLELEPLPGGDTLVDPLMLTAPEGDGRLFIVERAGRIRIFDETGLIDAPFLDISDMVSLDTEGALAGLAFHPDYKDNGRLFLNYLNHEEQTIVAEYRVSEDDPNRADPGAVRVLMTIDQPEPIHNGGMMQFGPDGHLYIAMGDGGIDPFTAQDAMDLRGAILRIDVDHGDPYAVPPANTFAASDEPTEVWASGLRNPYRFWIDDTSELVYIADVGEEMFEEIDVVSVSDAGVNFGWPYFEGSRCTEFSEEVGVPDPCESTRFEPPLFEYSHAGRDVAGCAVIGGPVYRGSRIAGLDGVYIYGDLCQRWIRGLRVENGVIIEHLDWSSDIGDLPGLILSFGVDSEGEVYVLTGSFEEDASAELTSSNVFKLVERN